MSVTVANTDAQLSGKTLVTTDANQTIDGLKTYDRGTSAPFAVVSGAAKVANLDADLLDGEEATDFHDAAQLTGIVPAASLSLANLWSVLSAAQDTSATGAQADFAPSAGDIVVIRCTGAAPVFSGFSGGVAGRIVILECLGTSLKVEHETTSTAANRIICESASGQIVGERGSILLAYDATTARWRAKCLAVGTPLSYTPTVLSAGGGAATYTAQAGHYVQNGRQVTVLGDAQLATKGTLAAGQVRILGALPFSGAGISAAQAVVFGYFGGMTTSVVGLWAHISAANADLYHLTAAGAAPVATQVSDISTSFRFMVSATYTIP